AEQEGQQTETEATGAPQKHHYTLNQQVGSITSANSTVIIIMSVAFFGQGMVGLGWTLISDIAPENMAGLTGGIFNFCANMASIIAPLIIGVIISATGNFFYALIYVGLTALIGVIAYIFIIGDIKRIELK
ncbi:MFS transporter, partial [Klebsiella pneumoniae]|uniref:MFS transporter n=1 Tax=Klebsiella pneumoniae TaxID=573 RepID=UPI00216434B0